MSAWAMRLASSVIVCSDLPPSSTPKTNESGRFVLCVREAGYVVDQVPFNCAVFDLEVPVDAFAAATLEVADDRREGAVRD